MTIKSIFFIWLLTLLAIPAARAEAPVPAKPPADGNILITVFLRHDQSKTLDQINALLEKSHFHERFPPPGVEVVSWYVMMGVGQVVTVKLPPEKLRDLNLALEQSAWGAFHTEFYPTYDYRSLAEAARAAASERKKESAPPLLPPPPAG
jgi:hypothetical protein